MTPRSELEALFDRLTPIHRSLAGPGFRAALSELDAWMPTRRLSFPTGATVFDWTVPPEWDAWEAHLIGPVRAGYAAHCWADFRRHPLHLVVGSAPFRGRLPRAALDAHLHSLPERPDAIPYVTSYFQSGYWGFCLSHRERERMPEGEYAVVVDTSLRDGALVVGEATLPGELADEVLWTSYLCHPGCLAQNETTGPVVLAALYRRVAAWPRRRLTHRFVVGPETIGALCYLHHRSHEPGPRWTGDVEVWVAGDDGAPRGGTVTRSASSLSSIVAGYVLTCLGLPTYLTYKRTRRGDSLADRAAVHASSNLERFAFVAFDPVDGSDERQYGSPGFDLPVGSLMRGRYLDYPEYHTSDDVKAIVSFDALARSVDAAEEIAALLDANALRVRRAEPCGEPFLSARGLYPALGGQHAGGDALRALLWLLNLCDDHDLIGTADRSGVPWRALAAARDVALGAGLVW